MGDKDKTIKCEDSEPSAEWNHASTYQETQEETVMNPKDTGENEPTEGSNLLNNSGKKLQEIPTESNIWQKLRQNFACPPHGLLDRLITNGM